MNVTKLIDLVSQFSFSSTPTVKQREVYLRCLNLANLELYQRILNSNQFYKSKELFQEADGTFIITDDIFYLKKIYNKTKGLLALKLDENSCFLNLGEYYREGKILSFGDKTFDRKDDGTGTIRNYVKIIYIEYPKTLVEQVNDANIEVSTPIYESPFHQTLVQGALYHLLLSTKGYAEKTNMQYLAYIESKKNFDRYYDIK